MDRVKSRANGAGATRARCIRVRESVLDPRNAGGGLKVQQKRGEAWKKRGPLRFGTLGEMGGGRGRKAVYRKTAAQRDESTTCCVDTKKWKNGTSFKSQIGTSNNRGSFGEAVEA